MFYAFYQMNLIYGRIFYTHFFLQIIRSLSEMLISKCSTEVVNVCLVFRQFLLFLQDDVKQFVWREKGAGPYTYRFLKQCVKRI